MAGSEATAGSEFTRVLLGLSILVIGAKLGGLLVTRWGQPGVLGELLFGIMLANLYPLFSGGAGQPGRAFCAPVGRGFDCLCHTEQTGLRSRRGWSRYQ
jgi:hypothetical protein